MFSFNSGQRLPKLSEVYQWWHFDPKGQLVIEFLSSLKKITPSLDETPIEDIQIPPCGPIENIDSDHAPEDRFMDGDNDHLLDFDFPQASDSCHRKEGKGLAPDFIGNICLNRIFTESWKTADLKHALTGLDYLSNLEYTRRTALREAAHRLHINEYTWREVLDDNREARSWVYSIQEQEDGIERYYSTLFVDLRVWIMVKELQAEPFYKPNVIAMLNTLFPPVIKELPTARISKKILHKYRNTFYRQIVSIEANGKEVLDGFIKELTRPGTAHTWPNTRQNLRDYVNLADLMIKQAAAVHGISFFKNRPPEDPFLQVKRISSATSDLSDGASINNSANTSFEELKLISDKSRSRGATIETKVSSFKSSIIGGSLQEQTMIFPKRSKISGRPIPQRIGSKNNVETPFQPSHPTAWLSSPTRQSSLNGRGSIDSSNGARFYSGSFSRPTTPSIEQQKYQRRTSSVVNRLSYDFRNTLPGTPELPSPPSNIKAEAPKYLATSQATLSLNNGAFLEESYESERLAPKTKKSAFDIFRRKKKCVDLHISDTVVQTDEPKFGVSSKSRKSTDNRRTGETVPSNWPTLKKKSSFSFLQGPRSRADPSIVSESNSERTIIHETSRPKFKLRTRASLSSLFVNKEGRTSEASLLLGDDRSYEASAGETVHQRRRTLRKARSASSIKSAGSAKSSEAHIAISRKLSASSGTPSAFDEDRVITSADITEPFPFGNFVQPQTPAMLLEDSGEFNSLEEIRQRLINKARQERAAKWEQSEEFKRKLEVAREKRMTKRAETNIESFSSKRSKHRTNEAKEKKETRARAKFDPKTPDPHAKGSEDAKGKSSTPKTPLKARIIKEIAKSYSPTM